MGILDDPPAVRPFQLRTPLRAALGGLLAAAVAASVVCRVPAARMLSWTALLGSAAQSIFAVSLACAIAASLLCPSGTGRKLDHGWLVGRASLDALWLAPLTLLIREKSSWTVPVAAVFAVAVTRLLESVREATDQHSAEYTARDAIEDTNDHPLLVSLRPDSSPLSFRFAPTISAAAALSAQAGAMSALAGDTLLAAPLIGGAFTAWTWSSLRNTPPHAASPSAAAPPLPIRHFAAVALIFLLMVGGLVPYLRISRGFGHRAGASPKSFWRLLPGGASPRPAARLQVPNEPPSGESEGDPGIVLWPAKQAPTRLIAPMPTLKTGLASIHESDPLIIPFNGVYWFFKSPEVQPPKTSRQAHASPETVDIRSTDRRPLSIEAHDYLGNLINLDCCSSIQIAIRNADRYPQTIFLELVLVDTSLPDKPSQSLGTLMVKSTRPWNIYEKQAPASETLNFAIPRSRSLRQFDEVKIVFRMDRARADTGAKIGIDHFVLVPRAL